MGEVMLKTLDGEIAPFGGPMTGFEVVYGILCALNDIANQLRRSANAHEAMYEMMKGTKPDDQPGDTIHCGRLLEGVPSSDPNTTWV